MRSKLVVTHKMPKPVTHRIIHACRAHELRRLLRTSPSATLIKDHRSHVVRCSKLPHHSHIPQSGMVFTTWNGKLRAFATCHWMFDDDMCRMRQSTAHHTNDIGHHGQRLLGLQRKKTLGITQAIWTTTSEERLGAMLLTCSIEPCCTPRSTRNGHQDAQTTSMRCQLYQSVCYCCAVDVMSMPTNHCVHVDDIRISTAQAAHPVLQIIFMLLATAKIEHISALCFTGQTEYLCTKRRPPWMQSSCQILQRAHHSTRNRISCR